MKLQTILCCLAITAETTKAATQTKVTQDKPTEVVMTSASGSSVFHYDHYTTTTFSWNWKEGSGGRYSMVMLPDGLQDGLNTYYEEYDNWGANGAGSYELWEVIYRGNNPPARELVDFGTNSFSGFPWEIGSLSDLYELPDPFDPRWGNLSLNSKVSVQLRTGGKGGSKLKNIFALQVGATAYHKVTLANDFITPVPTDAYHAVAPVNITIPGSSWVDDNGVAYGIFPDNTTVDITPQVRGEFYYSFSVGATKYKSHLTLYARMPDPTGCELFPDNDTGHAWWLFTTEAPTGGIGRYLGPDFSYYIGKTAGFYPTTITWLFPLGADFNGMLEVPDDGNQGQENAQKTYEIGFDDLKHGIFFTKRRYEQPGHWNGLVRNCVHAARDAAKAAGVSAPYAIFPETFGHKLRSDNSCP